MKRNEAITHARQLWESWVSLRPAVGFNGYIRESCDPMEYKSFDLPTIHRSFLSEYRWIRTGKSSATPALISKVRGELVLLGKIRKVLGQKNA